MLIDMGVLSGKKAPMTQREARRRKDVALMRIRELQLRKEQGLLISVAAVERKYAELMARFRDRALSLPDRLASRLAGQPEGSVRDMLRTELEETLRVLHGEANG
jgi:hypothetical protein